MPRYKTKKIVEPTLKQVMSSIAICYKKDKEREESYVWHQRNNYREKQLKVDYVASRLYYDSLYGDLYWKIDYRDADWSAQHAGTLPYDPDVSTYLSLKLDGIPLLAHRVACAIMIGEWPKYVVDHANHVVTDNRWENIRPATFQENTRNKYSRSACGYKGVSRRGGSYVANICVDGKQVHLGSYADSADAARAYDAAAERLFKDFALTNKSMGLIT